VHARGSKYAWIDLTLSRRLLAQPARCARPSIPTLTLAGPHVAAAAQATRRRHSCVEWLRHGGRVRGGQPSMADRRGLGRACPCVAGCGSSTTGTAWALHGSAARARSTGTRGGGVGGMCGASGEMRVATRRSLYAHVYKHYTGALLSIPLLGCIGLGRMRLSALSGGVCGACIVYCKCARRLV
jgi:hypothetical protein